MRHQIISLYEFDYTIFRKLEEEYSEMQFQENYFKELNQALAPNFIFDDQQEIKGIRLPLNIPEGQKNILLSYLWKIQKNREYIINYYSDVEEKIRKIRKHIMDKK